MPWVDKDRCTGCETCVGECPVNTIYIENGTAEINMANCIRCGVCHEVCPADAVRHDSEKTEDRVNANVTEVKKFMSDCQKYLNNVTEGSKCLNRMIKHYENEKSITEKTLEKLKVLSGK